MIHERFYPVSVFGIKNAARRQESQKLNYLGTLNERWEKVIEYIYNLPFIIRSICK